MEKEARGRAKEQVTGGAMIAGYGVATSANGTFSSSSSGATTIIRTLTMPDGKPFRVLNKDIFDRALEKSKKKKR